MIDIPSEIANDEKLHRRIHPMFVKHDGSVSSQAFRDPEMSVDRGDYRHVDETLANYEECGVAAIAAYFARSQDQEVVEDPDLFNPAHALVKGKKTKSVAKRFARAASWVVRLQNQIPSTETG